MSIEKQQYTLEELRKMKSKTDIKKFNETTEKQIKEQIMADPDFSNLTEDELKEFDFPKKREKKDEK